MSGAIGQEYHERRGMLTLIGDGGHAKVVRDILRYRSRVLNGEGSFIAVGDNVARKREAESRDGPFATVVSIHAVVSSSAIYGEGTLICEGAVVQAGVKIGRHVIINAGAVVTHDCVIGDYAHIAPGAVLCGGVVVGEGALVGVGVALEPLVQVPSWSVVKRERYLVESVPSYKRL